MLFRFPTCQRPERGVLKAPLARGSHQCDRCASFLCSTRRHSHLNAPKTDISVSSTVNTTSSSTNAALRSRDFSQEGCVDGYWCIFDGEHDNMFVECSGNYEGIKMCPNGTRCAGTGRYDNDTICVAVTESTSTSYPTTSDIEECPVEGYFCVIVGVHDKE